MRTRPAGAPHSSAASRTAASAGVSWLSRAPPGGPQVSPWWLHPARRISRTSGRPEPSGAQISSPAAPCLPQCRWSWPQPTQPSPSPCVISADDSSGNGRPGHAHRPQPPSDPVSALLTMRRTRLADVLEGLRRARSDDRVKALVVKLGGRAIGLARVQELRAAVQEFARAGKATVAWAETFGEFSPGNVPYYLATAFDRIYLQPSGELELTGISIQQLFFRDALDKLGLDYQVAKRQEYK